MTSRNNVIRYFYEYDPDANSFAGVGFNVGGVDDDDNSKVIKLHRDDAPQRQRWKTLACHGFDDNPPEVGDFPSVSNYRKVPMASERAWKVLEPYIGRTCEILPVHHPFKGNYYLIHVLRTIDALDEINSLVERRSEDDSRIRHIIRYAFREELIEGIHIFKLPSKSGSGLIVDDVFRNAVELNGLRGLRFHELSNHYDR